MMTQSSDQADKPYELLLRFVGAEGDRSGDKTGVWSLLAHARLDRLRFAPQDPVVLNPSSIGMKHAARAVVMLRSKAFPYGCRSLNQAKPSKPGNPSAWGKHSGAH